MAERSAKPHGFLSGNTKGSLKPREHRKIRAPEESEACGTVTTNMKHSPAPSQININPYSKGLITSLPTTTYQVFNQKKLQGILKDKRKTV